MVPLAGAIRFPKWPNMTATERSLYRKFGQIETTCGVTLVPLLRFTLKSSASSVLGRIGQLNSTGSPSE